MNAFTISAVVKFPPKRFNFWLNKLNSFGGNFTTAEMVKAFITSTEYRQRFGS